MIKFMERQKNKAWSKEQDRNDVEFWEQQKEEFLQKNPTHLLVLAEMEGDE